MSGLTPPTHRRPPPFPGIQRGLLAALTVLSGALALRASEAAKQEMERAYEDRIIASVSKFVDPSQFAVVVKVELYTNEELHRKSRTVSAEPADAGASFVLPGIPGRSSISKIQSDEGKSSVVQSDQFVKRLSITLLLDPSVREDTAQNLEILIKQLVDFDQARNDAFQRRKQSFNRTGSSPEVGIGNLKVQLNELRGRPDFFWLVIVAIFVAAAIVFFFFLLYLLQKFPRVFQSAFPPLPAVSPSGGGGRGFEGGAPLSGMKGEMTLVAGQPLTMVMDNSTQNRIEVFLGEPEKIGYNFLTDQDIVNILTLMKDEPPLHLAVICYYLRPDLASQFLSRLDATTRKQIVDTLAAPQMLLRDDVKSLGETLKLKVRGIVAGVDQFFAIYDTAAPQAQSDMMQALETNTPQLAEKMRSEMFTFEDLMVLDNSMLRIVFRELPLRTLALALMGSATQQRDRILAVLPQGASEIIRQEIEMNPVRSQKVIDDEKRKVVQVVRRLVWDKRIVMPARSKVGIKGASVSVSKKG